MAGMNEDVERERLKAFRDLVFFERMNQGEAFERVWGKASSKAVAATSASRKFAKLKSEGLFDCLIQDSFNVYQKILKSGNESNQLKVAADIFDRAIGRAVAKIDHTTNGEKLQNVNLNINGVEASELVQALKQVNNGN